MAVRTHAVEPVQARAQATRELLITAAAELLGEVGVERLSTNLVCGRAGVTPPAFYRYFKDKYAILEELGVRLMAAQNEAIMPLLARPDLALGEADVRALILESIAITAAFPGGPWILRALRAVPALQHVRLESHRLMSELIAKAAAQGAKVSARRRLQARLLVDMGYAAIELAFDEGALRPRDIAAEAAASLSVLLDAALNGAAKSRRKR